MRRLIQRLTHPGDAGPAASFGLLLLRMVAGGLMVTQHGWNKLSRFNDLAPSFPDPLGIGSTASLALAVIGEVAGAALLTVGAATRAAAIPAAITMIVAVFVVHSGDPLARKELALLYLAPYLTLVFTGAGRFSVDAYLGRG